MFRLLGVIIGLFFCITDANATLQEPEKLYYNGKIYTFYKEPLEPYFEKFPNKRVKGDLMSTALRRNYIATYEIVNREFLLKDIEIKILQGVRDGQALTTAKNVVNKLKPTHQKFKLDWYSDLLVMHSGEIIQPDDQYHDHLYEQYLVVEIDSGNVTFCKEFTGSEFVLFRDQQFEYFRKTAQYRTLQDEAHERFQRWIRYKLTDDYKQTGQYQYYKDKPKKMEVWDEKEYEGEIKQLMFNYLEKLLP